MTNIHSLILINICIDCLSVCIKKNTPKQATAEPIRSNFVDVVGPHMTQKEVYDR